MIFKKFFFLANSSLAPGALPQVKSAQGSSENVLLLIDLISI